MHRHLSMLGIQEKFFAEVRIFGQDIAKAVFDYLFVDGLIPFSVIKYGDGVNAPLYILLFRLIFHQEVVRRFENGLILYVGLH